MRQTFIIKPDGLGVFPPDPLCPLRVRSIRGFHLVKRRVVLPKFQTVYKQAVDQGCSFPEAVFQTSPQCIANVDTAQLARHKISSVTIRNPGIGFTAIPQVLIQDQQLIGSGASAAARLSLTMVEIRQAGSGYGPTPILTFEFGDGIDMLVEPVLEPVIEGGVFTSVRIKDPGLFTDITPFSASPLEFRILIEDGSGEGAKLKGYFGLGGIEVLTQGLNYENPKVIIDEAARDDAPDQEADGEASHSGGVINRAVLRRGGMGYRIAPEVEVEDRAGDSAEVSSQLELMQIQIVSGGTAYETPQVVVEGGGYSLQFGAEGDADLGVIHTDSLGIITHITLKERGVFSTQPTVTILETASGGAGAGATALASMTVRNLTVEAGGQAYEEPTLVIDSPETALVRSDRARQFLVKFNGHSAKYPELKRLFETPLKGEMSISQGALIEDTDPTDTLDTYEFTATGGSSFFYHTKKYDVTAYGNLTYKVRGRWDRDLKTFVDATLHQFHFTTNITMFDNIHKTSISLDFYLPPRLGEDCVEIFTATDYCLHFYKNPVDLGNPEDPDYLPPGEIPETYKPFLAVAKMTPMPRLKPVLGKVYGIESIEIRERKTL